VEVLDDVFDQVGEGAIPPGKAEFFGFDILRGHPDLSSFHLQSTAQ
jgi:hypothetical protein